MQNSTQLTIKDSSLVLDLENGAKITRLVLAGVTVIDSKPGDNFTSSGSFLMYPWVNRVEQSDKYLFKDNNGLPIHGIYASATRQWEHNQHKQGQATLRVVAEVFDLQYPKFMETFILTENKLTIKFEITEPITMGPVSFGYHPYLQLGSQKLSDAKFNTDISSCIQLRENMLPKHPFEYCERAILPSQKYDHLFGSGSYFQIQGQTGKLRISSDLPYWQIYTPDQFRIAVEPMSFTGNIFSIFEGEDYTQLRTEGTVSIQMTPK